MRNFKTIKYSDSLENSLIAILVELNVEVYRLDDELIILDPDELLPEEYAAAIRIDGPLSVMGRWAKSISVRKIKK